MFMPSDVAKWSDRQNTFALGRYVSNLDCLIYVNIFNENYMHSNGVKLMFAMNNKLMTNTVEINGRNKFLRQCTTIMILSLSSFLEPGIVFVSCQFTGTCVQIKYVHWYLSAFCQKKYFSINSIYRERKSGNTRTSLHVHKYFHIWKILKQLR